MNRFQQRRIGRTDLQVSVLGLGGAPLGDLYERIPPDWALATLETAYWRGIRLFDTAPLYGHGLSEHRFGHVLRDKPRAEFVISTKVGRWLRPERSEQVDRGQFVGGLNFQTVYDYSYDGTMRALEQSYQRLGMDRIDIALIHDVDIWTHGSAEAYESRFRQAVDGAYRALDELRRSGVVRAIGVGINEVAPCVRFANEAAFDCFLLAGRYTLLEQNGLDDLLPLAEQQGFSCWLAAHSTRKSWPPVLRWEQNITISRRRRRFSNAWRGLTSSANATMCHWRRQPSSFLLAIQASPRLCQAPSVPLRSSAMPTTSICQSRNPCGTNSRRENC